jgi:CRP/FNR family transcriptional regulator
MIPMEKIKKEHIEHWFGSQFENELLDDLLNSSQLMEIQSDEVILRVGDSITRVPLLLEGSVKISRENDQAEELLLYYLEGGDTCALTVQCCLGTNKSEIKATTIEKVTLLMLPVEKVNLWFNKYISWREFVLKSYQDRMMELLETIDVIAFMRLDERLMKYLIDQAKLLGSLEIHVTHKKIAADLNSSRAVISRVLKQLELKKKISLHRNKIMLDSI